VNTDPIFTAVEQLHETAGDGPATRKLIDALFRHVHNLKANASANGLHNLAAAAHEFENVLHSIRTGAADTFLSNAIPADVWNSLRQDQKSALTQSLAEGARLFLVEASFDVAHFDRAFQRLEQTLGKTGEVISRLPNATAGKVNFRILYAHRAEADLPNISDARIEEIAVVGTTPAKTTTDLAAVERAFEKLSAELINLPAASDEGVLQQALRAGRAAAVVTGKQVDFELRGEDLLLDEIYVNPLVHLVRNAVDHGIERSEERVKLGKPERGKIVIEAAIVEEKIRITVTDDGRGIDAALMAHIFNPGFSTAAQISEISGRGVGLDAVKTSIEEAGGTITVSSEVGRGSTFAITIPS
jgi:two-component system, chemotaxis family, sensor kinase CheA